MKVFEAGDFGLHDQRFFLTVESEVAARTGAVKADTTANEYMQELPESVQQMVGTVYAMLTSTAIQQQ